jgi:hypothetical protein
MPELTRCAVCSEKQDGHEAEHKFELDKTLPTWHGWYSLRRGVATALAGLTKGNGLASKGLLRHTNLATTTRHYLKDIPEDTLSAMQLLENLCTSCAPGSPIRPN